MNSSRADLIELSSFAWQRFRRRMDGLTDDEYFWEPVALCRTVRRQPDGSFKSDGPADRRDERQFTSLAWRLCHIVEFLREDRNGPWLGLPPSAPHRAHPGEAGSASEVLADLDQAYAYWHDLLSSTTDESLQELIGPVGAMYEKDTRRSFALHILDELIHHGAEAALLRDLYAATRASQAKVA
jgi:uncharacterized damage-inducible protein DinB